MGTSIPDKASPSPSPSPSPSSMSRNRAVGDSLASSDVAGMGWNGTLKWVRARYVPVDGRAGTIGEKDKDKEDDPTDGTAAWGPNLRPHREGMKCHVEVAPTWGSTRFTVHAR
ncbi:hypothetical protein PMIN01_05608 [Paraphaeosphaeria minitans]|uniref:Uncharacterized protein n=1 Tax=Paraphaeosphaeria minitans TaxID=565426 RepID=A0A9P6GHX3_9PLEO|nr:hypothetical protein PMIN01_05608 [Paraphaeosphaeria minitans]